ncbi:MAG: hypothetical protein EON84_10125 [Bradyrhizobiaceae bacterium]|jgi:hypothetical protein|nr:MAG: hypothetical protein EON84_10125 [Bradyrhizobiaceae bacterium]
MNIGTTVKLQLQSRRQATGWPSPWAARRLARRQIFKKTPFVAGLHSVSRDVVKDIAEVETIPLLQTTLPDQDFPQGFAAAGRAIMERPTAVTLTFPQGVLHFADKRFAASVDVVAGMETEAVNASFTLSPNAARRSNGNLTPKRWDTDTSEMAASTTKSRSEVLMTFDGLHQFANAGACLSGGDLENHRYADV